MAAPPVRTTGWLRFALAHAALPALLVCALLVGLIYVQSVPPWQVPDEPRHMGYVRELWLAMRGADASLEQAEGPITDSMRRHRWVEMVHRTIPAQAKVLDDIPFLRSSTRPRGAQPPAYYLLSAAVLHLSGQEDVDRQLYLVRFLGVLMGLIVVAAAYWSARTLLPNDRLFAVLAALLVALLPQRAFMAAGVNNDNLAILAGSLAFLAIIRLAVLGPGLWRILAVVTACALVVASKATAWPVLATLVFLALGALCAWLARQLPRRAGCALGGLALGVALLGALLILDLGGNAMAWVKRPGMLPPRTVVQSPGGSTAFRVDAAESEQGWHTLTQALSPATIARIAGRTVTVGVWARTPRGPQRGHIVLSSAALWCAADMDVDTNWKFASVSCKMPPDLTSAVVLLHTGYSRLPAPNTVLFSGAFLVDDDLSQAPEPPAVLDNGRRMAWQDRLFDNLLVNGSAYYGAISLKGFLLLSQAVQKSRIADALLAVEYLLDPAHYRPATVARYFEFTKSLFDSFWGQFGWMTIRLPSAWYLCLRAITGLAFMLTLLILAWRVIKPLELTWRWNAGGIALAFVVVVFGFLVAFLRQVPPVGATQGRYALPVVLPFALVFCFGFTQLQPKWLRPWSTLGVVSLLVVLNVVSLQTIIQTG